MSTKTSITVTTEIELDVEMAAAWFAGLDDEQQVQFFKKVCEVARASWPKQPGCKHALIELQWFNVGAHLGDCDCSSDDAREMIRTLAYAMEERIKNPRPKTKWTFPPDERTAQL